MGEVMKMKNLNYRRKSAAGWRIKKIKWLLVAAAVIALLIALFATVATAASPITVSVNAPTSVNEGATFPVSIDTTEAVNLSALQFDVTYNPAVLELTGVTGGEVGGTATSAEWEWVPVGGTDSGQIKVIAYAGTWTDWEEGAEVPAATGAGSLAEIQFTVVGTALQTSDIALSEGMVADSDAAEIPATWLNDSVIVFLDGDVNMDTYADMTDVMILWYDIANYGSPPPEISNACAADVNCDGAIDMTDVMILWYDIANYGSPPPVVSCCDYCD
jgi:hypothetical protein